jgi:hypothetical protein
MSDPTIPLSTTTEQLRALAFEHNWDDGFAFPQAVADHPSCDLALALELFWLANADEVYLGESIPKRSNADWHSFSGQIAERILHGYYSRGTGAFKAPLTRVQLYKYQKKGLPAIFLANIEAPRA